MEFVYGGDLGTYGTRFRQYNAEHKNYIAKLIIAEVSKALEYLHRKKIYHRDLKPANILIDKTVILFN